MFYDKFAYLCSQRGISPSRAAVEAGISKSLVTKWKTNNVQDPSADIARKIAAYFGISVAELLEEDQTEKPLINGDEELTEYVQMLKTRPECRMLFQLSRNATKEDVEAAVRIIEALRNK